MHWRTARGIDFPDQLKASQGGAFVAQLFNRQFAETEIFPPCCLLFPAVPVQNIRQHPAPVLLGILVILPRVHVSRDTLGERLDHQLSLIDFFGGCAVISSLRRKLRDDAENPNYIFTELRVGYRMARGEAQM